MISSQMLDSLGSLTSDGLLGARRPAREPASSTQSSQDSLFDDFDDDLDAGDLKELPPHRSKPAHSPFPAPCTAVILATPTRRLQGLSANLAAAVGGNAAVLHEGEADEGEIRWEAPKEAGLHNSSAVTGGAGRHWYHEEAADERVVEAALVSATEALSSGPAASGQAVQPAESLPPTSASALLRPAGEGVPAAPVTPATAELLEDDARLFATNEEGVTSNISANLIAAADGKSSLAESSLPGTWQPPCGHVDAPLLSPIRLSGAHVHVLTAAPVPSRSQHGLENCLKVDEALHSGADWYRD